MPYNVYMVTTLLGGSLGDFGVRRFGAAAVVRLGAVVAAAGFAVVAAAPGAWVGMLGFTLLGLGLCVLVPQTFAAAGRLFPRGVGHGDRAAERLQLRRFPGRVAAGGSAGGRVELPGRDGRADGAGAGDAAVRPVVRAASRPDTVSGMSGRAQLMWDERVTGYDFGPGPSDGSGAAGADQGSGAAPSGSTARATWSRRRAAGESTLRLVHRRGLRGGGAGGVGGSGGGGAGVRARDAWTIRRSRGCTRCRR